jgi:DNA-binding transcriptional ArsR family regulator
MLQYSQVDRIFHALADPTRRAIVERLAAGPSSVSELAARFPVSLSAIGQHIAVLESDGLVRTSKAGRVRTVAMNGDALAAAERWFSAHRARWEERLDRLGRLLEEDDDTPHPRRRKR